jgi:hypothetical protein
MHSPIWQLCIWILEEIAQYVVQVNEVIDGRAIIASAVVEATAAPSMVENSTVYQLETKVVELASCLFESAPYMRESITTVLISFCFPQHQGNVHGSTLSSSSKVGSTTAAVAKSGISLNVSAALPPLAGSLRFMSACDDEMSGWRTSAAAASVAGLSVVQDVRDYKHDQYRSRGKATQLAFAKALAAVSVLDKLCVSYPTVGEVVLQAILSRIYQQLTDNEKLFPSCIVFQL